MMERHINTIVMEHLDIIKCSSMNNKPALKCSGEKIYLVNKLK